MEWSRQQVLRLVDMYHDQPALWDTSDPRFKDRQAKRWSLMAIASQMSLPPIDIEKKIHCLRTQFNREYLKMKTSARRPTWFAYQPLTFVLRNKLSLREHMSQWKPDTIMVKEEFLDEYVDQPSEDDVEMRLTMDENPSGSLNFMKRHDDGTNDSGGPVLINEDARNSDGGGNNREKEKDGRDQEAAVLSDNEFETGSAGVQVILREPVDDRFSDDNPPNLPSSKRFCKPDNHICLNQRNNDFSSRNGRPQQQIQQSNNSNNNIVNSVPADPGLDELAIFGRLLTDELLKVVDYYTLQLAKYEIAKIIFKATTGAYDKTNCSADPNCIGDIKWKNDKTIINDVRTEIDSNRMSSLDELRTFSSVVINELRTIADKYSLQVAKFRINQVIFLATTARIMTQSGGTGNSDNRNPLSRSRSPNCEAQVSLSRPGPNNCDDSSA